MSVDLDELERLLNDADEADRADEVAMGKKDRRLIIALVQAAPALIAELRAYREQKQKYGWFTNEEIDAMTPPMAQKREN